MENIAIIVNTQKKEYVKYIDKVIAKLKGRVNIYLSDECDINDDSVKMMPYQELFRVADCVLVMGGDGTIIRASSGCVKNNIPILGINIGRIGFMADIEPESIDFAIDALLNGEYRTEKRIMIKAEIKKNGKTVSVSHALNDIVISKSLGSKLIGVNLYTDNELVNRYISDGIIIATPTGSTGYSISAGGPVVDPSMDLYVATPICAHMLSVRSAILSTDKDIKIELDKEYGENKAVVSADGELKEEIINGDEVIISRSEYELKLIKIGEQSFYDTLLKKLS